MRLLHRIPSTLTRFRLGLSILLVLFCVLYGAAPAHAQQLQYPTQPTPEELSMTTQPQVPGAAAVYLYYEETTDDSLFRRSYYVRLKVLTEAGKEYANVRLMGGDVSTGDVYISDSGYTVNNITGRTIHSDGTVVPFSGKPYERTVEKTKGFKETEKVFTLPDVQVGSILEYHYDETYNSEGLVESPTWIVQRDLFVRKGYFLWKSVDQQLQNLRTGEISQGIAWSAILPEGAAVKTTAVPGGGTQPYHRFELSVHDVVPAPQEEHMPPLASFVNRVNFYVKYSKTSAEFWRINGAAWAKEREHFIGSPESMKSVVDTLVAPGDTDKVKLQKIYAAVMSMDNTSFTRAHEQSEDKAAGLKEVKTAQDIWQRKRGDNDELTLLFIALARSAGMKAYDMRVTDRDKRMFSDAWLSMGQLEDDVAIVVLDGKEQFFDPGQKECPFGQMAWKHTGTGGIRETPDGTTTITTTPEPLYSESQTVRFADLTLKANGIVVGTVQVTWTGAPALDWRQQYVLKDDAAVKHAMGEWMSGIVPSGLKADLTGVDNLDAYEKPLMANYVVYGTLATVTAKRLILPSQFFETNSKPLFPQPTRSVPIYFAHSARNVDQMRLKLPANLQVESAPKEDSFTLLKLASYHSKPVVQPGVVVTSRSYVLGTAFFSAGEYADTKTFYDKIAADDQQPLLLSIGEAPAPAAGTTTAP